MDIFLCKPAKWGDMRKELYKNVKPFSLIELLVVVAIIAILLTLIQPGLRNAIYTANITVCKNNLKQIAYISFSICDDYNGVFLPARNSRVQISFNQEEHEILEDYSVATNNTMSKIWDCPGRDYVSTDNDYVGQWLHSYQYFGGIKTWQNSTGSYASKSPVSMQKSDPRWVLAADATLKVAGTWGGGRSSAFAGMPSHAHTEGEPPPASNHLKVDGSVEWVNFDEMYFFHSWWPGMRVAYFYQEDTGDIPVNKLEILKALP